MIALIVLDRYRQQSRRRQRIAARDHQRLDIQGLRMVAVLTVFAFHLCGWPRGGFVGVDVFFVISGFLITGNLLRTAETRGNVSFTQFYWNRIRRIVPAATVVLILTYIAAVLVFQPFRAQQVGWDALFAFIFTSNWWFATQQTDYFAAGDAVSPIQHYWSLSIEEQFYFVWPALIFLIGVVVARKAWTHSRRMGLAGAIMACVVAGSLIWALNETSAAPTWAYFNTFTRVWELGVGALLATAVGVLSRTPSRVKPWLSLAGLGLIAVSLILITESSAGFPAPWAILPVAGAALVIAAGVGGEPAQALLQNPISVYIGNISYSLYLIHWPVIVILGSLMPRNAFFYGVAVAFTFGLAVGSYHFIENPLRYSDWSKVRSAIRELCSGRFQFEASSRRPAMATLVLLTLGLTAYSLQPPDRHEIPPAATEAGNVTAAPQWGPVTTGLQNEIAHALTATEWPQLDPSIEEAIQRLPSVVEVHACGVAEVNPADPTCTFGTGAKRVVIAGDSVAVAYGGPLRELALQGKIQLHVAAGTGCEFVDAPVFDETVDACPLRKQQILDYINTTKPDVVIISNVYKQYRLSDRRMTSQEWSDALVRMIDKFRASTTQVILLSPPPADKNVKDCYTRLSVPADCISHVTNAWTSMAYAEQNVAAAVGGLWIDSRPWFCHEGLCPAFVGLTPTKRDVTHVSAAYGQKIAPALGESFSEAF